MEWVALVIQVLFNVSNCFHSVTSCARIIYMCVENSAFFSLYDELLFCVGVNNFEIAFSTIYTYVCVRARLISSPFNILVYQSM